jgi:hypothetical protein
MTPLSVARVLHWLLWPIGQWYDRLDTLIWQRILCKDLNMPPVVWRDLSPISPRVAPSRWINVVAIPERADPHE